VTNGTTLGLVGFMAVIVQGGLVRPIVRRFGARRVAISATIISAIAFLGYGLSSEGWMIPCVIVFGALGGLAGPAIQSIIAGQVPSSDQGKVQGAMTSLISLTAVLAPLIFTTGLFGYFTSSAVSHPLPGAPFFLGSGLLLTAAYILSRVFLRFPDTKSR